MSEQLSPLELSIIEDEKELARLEAEGKEETNIDEVIEQSKQDLEEETDQEEEVAEEGPEENEVDELEEIEAPKGNSDWAKMRKRLKEEKEKAAKAAQEKQEVLNRLAYIEGQMSKAAQPQLQEVEKLKEFDPEYEFEDYTKQKIATTEQTTQKTTERLEALEGELKSQLSALRAERVEAEAERANPNYAEAKKLVEDRTYNVLYKVHRRNLINMYPDATLSEIDAHLQKPQSISLIKGDVKRHVDGIIQTAVATGSNVADEVIDYAKNYGFNPDKKAGNQGLKPAGVNKEKIRQNMKKSASLINGGAGKGKASDRLTHDEIADAALTDLLNLDEAEWNNIQ